MPANPDYEATAFLCSFRARRFTRNRSAGRCPGLESLRLSGEGLRMPAPNLAAPQTACTWMHKSRRAADANVMRCRHN